MAGGSTGENEARLLIVAASLVSRAGLTAVLEERGCIVLGAVDGQDLQTDIDRLAPDLLVVDMGWEHNGARERLARIHRDLPLVALIGDDGETALARTLAQLRAFPRFALLLRDSDPDTIVAGLRALDEGLTAIDPRLSDLLGPALPGDYQRPADPLTAREDEVLQMLARGLTNRAIANELDITQHTVKFHVNAIMSKLDAQSRTEAVVRATQLGIIVL